MKARELALILEHVDPDTEVHLSARGCYHIDEVNMRPARRYNWEASLPQSRYQHKGDRIPPSLRLEGRTLWFAEPPRFELRGRFRGAALLDRQLDPEVP